MAHPLGHTKKNLGILSKRDALDAKKRKVPIFNTEISVDGSQQSFKCPHCKRLHHHGIGIGHRVAHCHKDDSPFKDKGYYLIPYNWVEPQPKVYVNAEHLLVAAGVLIKLGVCVKQDQHLKDRLAEFEDEHGDGSDLHSSEHEWLDDGCGPIHEHVWFHECSAYEPIKLIEPRTTEQYVDTDGMYLEYCGKLYGPLDVLPNVFLAEIARHSSGLTATLDEIKEGVEGILQN